MKQQPPLTRAELMDLHSVLRRAAERAERDRRIEDAARLAEAIANIDLELAVMR